MSDFICPDCELPSDKPFCNGDGVHRCEACAVEAYKIGLAEIYGELAAEWMINNPILKSAAGVVDFEVMA